MASATLMDNITHMLQSLQESGESEIMHQLYRDWKILVRQDDINISMDLRGKFDDWFLKCYKSCEDEGRRLQEENLYMFKQQNELSLYDELRGQLKVSIDDEKEFPVKLKLQHELNQLEETQAEEWIRRAHLCVKEERKLMDSYNKVRADTLYKSSRKQCETKYEEVAQKKKALQEKLDSLETLVQKYSQNSQEYDQRVAVMQDTTLVLQGLQERASSSSVSGGNMNGLQSRNHQQETAVRQSQADLDKKFQMFTKIVQEAYNKFEALFLDLQELLKILLEEILHWQKQLMLDYVELKATVDLERFAPWCAKAGQLLNEILDTELPRLQHAIQSVAGSETRDCSQVLASCDELNSHYRNLLNCFYQRTFVVTEQEGWCVKKKDKTQIPKVTVRVLAADSQQILGGATVKAYFVLEDSIKDDWFYEQDGCQQLSVGKIKGQQIKNNSEKFILVKKDHRYEGKFCNIILQGFDRGQRSKLVHEEKYRILFHTCVDNHEIWTLSLPMVVTTGANQNCQCLASVMWQCFSTNVFAVPIETKNELPWSTVAAMLNTKMEKLSSRKLSEENLEHLKHRIPELIKAEDNDPMVSLTQFCVDKLDKERANPEEDEKCPFSFWKWFLASYNLIEKYLQDYWKNGWIEGFISKSSAERKLKDSPRSRSAMYLLRFSDSYITDSQGLKSVFGFVTAAVLMIKRTKDNQKAKTVHHLDVAGHNKLKDKSLANILLGTEDTKHQKFYQFLYPDLSSSESLFSQYSSSDPVVPGYTGVRDAFIVDLEQALQKLELTGKRLSSSSSGSEDHDGYPDMKSPSLAGLKKIKRDSTETKPSCQQTANTPPTYDSSGNNTSSSMSQNIPMNTSSDFPTLRTLLTKPNQQQPVSVVSLQAASSYPDTMSPVSNAGSRGTCLADSLPTFLADISTVDTQAIHDSQSIANIPFTSSSSLQAGNQATVAMDPNAGFMQVGSQELVWSQDGFNEQQNTVTGLLQTDIPNQQPFHFTQNPHEVGALHQISANATTGNQSLVNMADTTGNQPSFSFTQNPNEAGVMHQVNAGNQPVVNMADTLGFYGNTGPLQAGGENNDPSLTELPKNISEEYIVNFVIQYIFPKMPQVQKEKLLVTLQEPTSPTEKVVYEDQQTPEDMVTSSSSGPLPFNQSQLEDGLESDSGQLVKDLTLFDTLPVDDDQQF